MKSTGRYIRNEDSYCLQGELDLEIDALKYRVNSIDSNGIKNNKKEIIKGMINFLVEQL